MLELCYNVEMSWITPISKMFNRQYYGYLNKRWYGIQKNSPDETSQEGEKIYRSNKRMGRDVRNWSALIAIVFIGCIFTVSDQIQIFWLTVAVIFFIFFSIYGHMSIYRESIIISQDGIAHRPPIGPVRKAPWNKIEKIYYDSVSKYLVICPNESGIFSRITVDLSYPNIKDILSEIDKLLPNSIDHSGIKDAIGGRNRLSSGELN